MKASLSRSRSEAAIVALLVVALSAASLPVSAQGARADLTRWEALEVTASGTRVRLTLTDGSEVEARLVDAEADSARFVENRLVKGSTSTAPDLTSADTRTYSRSDVAKLRILGPSPSFRSTETPDAMLVRRVVAALGVGATIDLTIAGSPKRKTRISSIAEDGFTIRIGRSSPMIPYDQVTLIQPAQPDRGRQATTIGLVVGFGVLAVGLLAFFACGTEGCS